MWSIGTTAGDNRGHPSNATKYPVEKRKHPKDSDSCTLEMGEKNYKETTINLRWNFIICQGNTQADTSPQSRSMKWDSIKQAKRSIRNTATKIAQTSQPTRHIRVQSPASQSEERTQPARKIGVKKGKESDKRRAANSYTVVKPCPRRRNRTGYNHLSTPSCKLHRQYVLSRGIWNITKFSCRRPRGDNNSRPATIDAGQRRRPDTNEKQSGRQRETNAKWKPSIRPRETKATTAGWGKRMPKLKDEKDKRSELAPL